MMMKMMRLSMFKRFTGSLHTHSYCIPPRAIMEVVNSPRGLNRILSPSKDKVLLLRKSILPPIWELARHEDRVAGLRIDAETNMRSREPWYTVEGIKNSQSEGPIQKIQGIPSGSRVHYFSWSKDDENICLTVQTNEGGVLSMLSVWVINALSLQARPLLPPNMFLNAVLFTPCFTWTNKSTLLITTIPLSRGPRPSRLISPSGPKIFSNKQNKIVQVRTYQGLLQDEYDESLFEYYATSQLVSVSLSVQTGEDDVKPVGRLGLYTTLLPSPFGNYLLVRSIQRPFSRVVTYKLFRHKVEVWNSINGDFIKEVCDQPLGDDIPCAEDSVRKGMRHIQWVNVKTPTLLWATAQDGGNAKIKIYPRDIVYVQEVDLIGTQAPKVLTKTKFRFNDLKLIGKKLHVVQKWKKKLYTTKLSKSSCGATHEVEFGATTFSVEVITCKRKDGQVVKANLYLPPVHDSALPCLIWPYPIEKHGTKRVISPDSPQIWLRRGFAVLTSLSMPEIDDVDENRYNMFIEKLVMSTEAVVKEIIDRGVVHPRKIAICGHSFGALMTSILLVHVPHLFCCGVARSGAYNRTLTPFGYQAEHRTLWEATFSYLEMSTILSADKLKKPLLLIHGQEDENAGTWPMQSIRLYEALRGHGAECRLVILPLEGHSYVARESVLHVLWEMDMWFQTHVPQD